MNRLFIESIQEKTFVVGVIDAYKCKNINALCKELKEAFNWPEGEHCMDAMYYLDWFEQVNFKIIVEKFNRIKNNTQKQLIKNELNNYQEYWNKRRDENKQIDKYHFLIDYK